MAVGNVSFGQQPVQNQKKSSGVIGGTLVSAGIGAGVTGGMNYLGQRTIIKHPKEVIKNLKKTADNVAKSIKANFGNTAKAKKAIAEYRKGINEQIKKFNEMAKTGKIDLKMLGKAAAVGAVVVGGIYLAYRGVKALFSNKEAA